jgi:hypothetical protein
MHVPIPLFQIGPKQLQRPFFMIGLPMISPVDGLNYVWQDMAEGTFISIDEEFVQEFWVLR